jgi:hypothetical protein
VLTLGALALVHELPFDVLLSARNLSQHLPEQSKLSRPIVFGARAADHPSHVTNIVVDKAHPKEAVPQKLGGSKKTITNPYAKNPWLAPLSKPLRIHMQRSQRHLVVRLALVVQVI